MFITIYKVQVAETRASDYPVRKDGRQVKNRQEVNRYVPTPQEICGVLCRGREYLF